MNAIGGDERQRFRDLGREGGLAVGLTAVLEGLDPASEAPGDAAVLPLSAVGADADVRPHPFAALDGLALVRFPRSGAGPGPGLTGRRAALLAAVRVGVLSRMLDTAVRRLSSRRFGGVPLIEHQLVGGALADLVTEMETDAAMPDSPSAEAAWDRHERLTEAGWAATRLFGAEGYITDHPARCLYLSVLTADLWLARPGPPEGGGGR
ncbi:acyl-CoA dehydrogenase family protein [Streptomyces sp. NPDC014882]|uniref:acyl-CoA dehydrogenase family protein n=1 Tax=Streptomyces sp. NPDC014882 TaxID=3364927 RepID=UPI0037005B81